ncbi:MAG: DUF4405 domain-containing protein [bacterium]|nr:DUF4405 domain-containing protein [bacterium]
MRMPSLRRFRPFISSCVLFSFIAIAITGLMLMVHYSPYGHMRQWKHIHEWFGVLFLVGGLLHLVVNWHAIKDYFGRAANFHQAFLGVGVCLFVLAALMMFPEPPGGPGRQRYPLRNGAAIDTTPSGAYSTSEDYEGLDTSPGAGQDDAIRSEPPRSRRLGRHRGGNGLGRRYRGQPTPTAS